ncbi:hypothetical protein MUP77_08685 [Candidatus Bathyarchaeota archaeon]|nr:hypothetical protein [Candidatus Bathyarchaeota archaeon]
MADKIHLGSDIIQFTVAPIGVLPPSPPIEVNWLLTLVALLAGAGATYVATT